MKSAEIKKYLRLFAAKSKEWAIYLRDIREHWPQIKSLLIELKGRAIEAVVYLRNIRTHWPEILELLKKYRDEAYRKRYEHYFAMAAYVPFIGWLAPIYLKRKNAFCKDHGKMGLLLAVFFAAAALSVYFFNLLFVPREWRVIRLFFVLVIYVLHLSYFSLCAWGMHRAYHKKRLEIPQAERYLDLIEL